MSMPILAGARVVPAEPKETTFCKADGAGGKARVEITEGEV